MKPIPAMVIVFGLPIVVTRVFGGAVTLQLFFGWYFFLVRVIPQLTVDPTSLMAGGVALVIVLIGGHILGRSWVTGWKIRWTFLGSLLLFVLFAAGTAMVAITHQIAWLSTSNEPMYSKTVPPIGGSPFHSPSTTTLKILGAGTANMVDSGGYSNRSGVWSWSTHVLPFIGYSANELDAKKSWDHPDHAVYFKTVIPVFINPAIPSAPLTDDRGYALIHFSLNQHLIRDGVIKSESMSDGTSTTLLIGEVNTNYRPWGQPVNWRDPGIGLNRSPYGFGGPRNAGGVQFVMADGSVRFISDRVNRDVLKALSTPNGGDEADASVLQPAR